MSAEKLSPRQQMIGMMYLVLLAMLAMNASKDLLDAFLKLESGIDLTANNFVENVQPLYNKINEAAATNSKEAKEALQKANTIKSKIQELDTLISGHKKWLITNSGGVDENGIPLAKDNQDIGAEYLMTAGHGENLRKKITALKAYITGLIDKKDTSILQSINTLLATDEYKDYEGTKTSWEAGISEHLPLAAVTANLSNIQSYLRNTESIAINYLNEELGINTYKVNKIQAATIAQSSYVLKGQEYNARIFLAASDTTQQPTILVGDYDSDLFFKTGELKFRSKADTLNIRDGFGTFTDMSSSVGEHSWKGVVRIPHPNPKRKGEFLTYPFENKYLVAQPSAVVSSDKLNIMYMSLENEISVSVPGISSDKLRVSANKCKIEKNGDGKFVFKPTAIGKTDVVVQAEISPGNWEKMGSYPWTIKKLPKPEIAFGKKSLGCKASKQEIIAVGKFIAKYSDDFPLSSTPKITSCKVEMNSSNGIIPLKDAVDGILSSDHIRIINGMRKGESLYFSITVKGADGIPHDIKGPIIIN